MKKYFVFLACACSAYVAYGFYNDHQAKKAIKAGDIKTDVAFDSKAIGHILQKISVADKPSAVKNNAPDTNKVSAPDTEIINDQPEPLSKQTDTNEQAELTDDTGLSGTESEESASSADTAEETAALNDPAQDDTAANNTDLALSDSADATGFTDDTAFGGEAPAMMQRTPTVLSQQSASPQAMLYDPEKVLAETDIENTEAGNTETADTTDTRVLSEQLSAGIPAPGSTPPPSPEQTASMSLPEG